MKCSTCARRLADRACGQSPSFVPCLISRSLVLYTGIEAFYRIKGHSRVPTRYIVPAEEPWPIEIWGHKLGSRVAQMRQTGGSLGVVGRRYDLEGNERAIVF